MPEDRSTLSSAVNVAVPVAIIGIGCLFPGADGIESYWANIQDRVDAITDVPASHWRPEDYFDKDPKKPDHTYAHKGGFLSPVDFPALDLGISPNTLEAIDTTQLLGLLVARQAFDSAGYGVGRDFDKSKVSVILGVTGTLELVVPLGARLGHPRWKKALQEAGVDDTTAKVVVQKIADSYVGWQEDSFPGLLGNVVAGRIANRLDLGGTNCVVDAACASSFSALHLGLLELATGRSNMVLAGGMDTFNDIFMYMCFSKTPALSPTGHSRPFDAKADGTILGEGLGCVLLKRLDDAQRDGDRIFAVIRGVGTSSDGKGQAIYAPSPAGQTKALRQAYRLADVTPATIELVEAHGTGTRAGDAAEVTALTDVYRSNTSAQPWCALGSVKSQIGHTKAAAGIAGLIKATLALYHKVLPPTIKVTQPIEHVAPGKTPFYINTEPRPWLPRIEHPRRAAVSAFGFGGSNFHCVLEEHGPAKTSPDGDARVQILAFSANTTQDLRAQLTAWPTNLSWDDLRIHAARARAAFSRQHRCRLTLVVERDKKDIAELLASALALLNTDKESAGTPDGIVFQQGKTPGKLAMIFPGQGSQYVGMMRDLTCRFGALQEALADANRLGQRRLSDVIYPIPAFTDDERTRHEDALRATDNAQPALGALSLGACRILESFQVRPDATAGHSYGELPALCAAGWIDADALHLLSQVRGQLMAQGTGDRGAMLAVRAPLTQIETILHEAQLDVVLANRNAPNQGVLSGSSRDIARAAEVLKSKGIECRPLPVSAAFHSRFVADARPPFQQAIDKTAVHPTSVPVYSNTTAREYPRDSNEAKRLLAGQLAEPVDFPTEIENLHRAGVHTFLEVGPGAKLTGLVSAILTGKPHAAFAVDASSGKRSGVFDLARTLAHLAALGYTVDLPRWDAGQADKQTRAEKKPTLTVPLCGANYVKPRATPPMKTPPSPKMETKPIMSQNGTNGHATPTNKSNGQPLASAADHSESKPTPRPAPKTTPPMSQPKATPTPAPMTTNHPFLAVTQENLVALQKLGEQTAQLHRQFLEGQDRALQVFQSLLDQQHRLMSGAPVAAPVTAAPVVTAPAAPVLAAPVFAASAAAAVAGPAVQTREVDVAPREAAPPSIVAAPPRDTGRFESILLEVVANKTGYPAEMLQLDMELDTDLGIDSIKRVEIFAVLQEKLPEAPPIKAEHLGTLRTLRHVVSFLGEGSHTNGTTNGHIEHAPPTVVQPANRVNVERTTEVFLAVVADKTGYPTEMLQLDMELDTDLGIDSIKRVEIFSMLQDRLPEAPAVKAEHLGTLRTLRHVIDFLTPASASVCKSSEPAPEPAAQARVPDVAPRPKHVEPTTLKRLVLSAMPLETRTVRRPVSLINDGEIWIAGDVDLARRVASRLDLLGQRARSIHLHEVAGLERPARLAGLLIVGAGAEEKHTFLKNAFQLLQLASSGLRAAGKTGGSVFATVSTLDGSFGLASDTDSVLGGLAGLAKTARHEWPEVHCKAMDLGAGWDDLDDAAFAIVEEMLLAGPAEVGLTPTGRTTLTLTSTPLGAAQTPLQAGDVVVVTGGARGVTAETAVALAEAFAPTLVLLGRSPAPTPEPSWLSGLAQEADIKKSLLARANGHASPRDIGEQYQALLANREMLRTLQRIEAAGAHVLYRQADVRDRHAVAGILDDVRRHVGPIRGLIHGAGVLADRLIEDKTLAQFESVYDTKVVGLEALLEATRDDDLRVLGLFSSSTGRYGRTGQVDYAVANEVLNKIAQHEARRRPHCRVVSVNWGPWDGGMVNASLKKIFAQEGVGVIPLRQGAQYFVREIAQSPGSPVEVVVMGELDKEIPPAEVAAPSMTVAFQRDVSLEAFPVLQSHVIKGHAVLPAAIIVEWLAHAALHANPGLSFHGFNDLRILKGVILPDDAPVSLRVLTGKAVKEDSMYRVPVEIRGTGRELLHARADILLATRLPLPSGEAHVVRGESYARSRAEIYSELLFHGPDLQGIERVDACSAEGIVGTVASAPAPAVWFQHPLRNTWLANPLVLDCAFQIMILWTFENCGAGSLPSSAGRYRQYRRTFPRDGVRIVARVSKQGQHRALADLDFLDSHGEVIARMYDYECVIDASLNEAFRANQIELVER